MTVITVEDHQITKKMIEKETQNEQQQQQQINNFCLPFGWFVMCAFDSQHVKLCSLLLCEIFSVCFVDVFGVHVALLSLLL